MTISIFLVVIAFFCLIGIFTYLVVAKKNKNIKNNILTEKEAESKFDYILDDIVNKYREQLVKYSSSSTLEYFIDESVIERKVREFRNKIINKWNTSNISTKNEIINDYNTLKKSNQDENITSYIVKKIKIPVSKEDKLVMQKASIENSNDLTPVLIDEKSSEMDSISLKKDLTLIEDDEDIDENEDIVDSRDVDNIKDSLGRSQDIRDLIINT